MYIELNWVDYVFLIIFLLSIIFGFVRGFIRDVMSLIFLIVAVFLAIKYSPQLAAHFAGNAEHEQTVSYLVYVGFFFLIFIVTILVGSFVSKLIQLGGVGFINSFLGGVFGIFRAAIITIVLIYVVQLTPAANQQAWRESKIVMHFQPTTEWLVKNISPTLEDLKNKMKNTVEDIAPTKS